MVSSIIPGATGANALGVDPRYTRPSTATPQSAANDAQAGDTVQIGDAAAWRAARESVSQGLTQLRGAIAAGQDVFGLLGQIAGLSQNGGSQSDLDSLLNALGQRVDQGVSDGARVLTGQDLTIQAEPGAPDFVVSGLDLRLKDSPAASDVIAVPSSATVDNPQALSSAAQKSLDSLQSGLARLMDALRALEAHQGFLGAAAGAVSGVRSDLDADGARLTALQVRQGLDAAGNGAIANVEPQAVLSLFRV